MADMTLAEALAVYIYEWENTGSRAKQIAWGVIYPKAEEVLDRF